MVVDVYSFCIFFIVLVFNVFIFVIESGYQVTPADTHTVLTRGTTDPSCVVFT